MWWQVALLVLGAYLLGSVPTAYIAGRMLKGVDIRDYGSRAASGTNVWHSISRWAVVPVGICDILKGLISVYIAYALGLTLFGETVFAQGLVGIAAIVGHNWPIFLGFSGGRGISTMMGVLIVLSPLALLVFIVIWLLGLSLGGAAVGAFFAALALPIVGWALPLSAWGAESSAGLALCLLAITLVLIVKRLSANRYVGMPMGGWKRVMVYRLIFDRDIPEREAWIYRAPSEGEMPKKK